MKILSLSLAFNFCQRKTFTFPPTFRSDYGCWEIYDRSEVKASFVAANSEVQQILKWCKKFARLAVRETLSIFRAANRVKVLLTPEFEVFKSIFCAIIINFPSHCECETWLKRTSNYWIKMCHILHAIHHRAFIEFSPRAKCRNFQRPESRQTKIEIILKITLSEI